MIPEHRPISHRKGAKGWIDAAANHKYLQDPGEYGRHRNRAKCWNRCRGHFRERVDDHIFPLWRHPGVTVMLKSRASHAEQMGARTRRKPGRDRTRSLSGWLQSVGNSEYKHNKLLIEVLQCRSGGRLERRRKVGYWR